MMWLTVITSAQTMKEKARSRIAAASFMFEFIL